MQRNKPVKTAVADEIVRRFVDEGEAASAVELVTDKLTYGLFPQPTAYINLMKATSEAGLPSETVAVFERMVLDGRVGKPPAECFEMLSQAAETEGVRRHAVAVRALVCVCVYVCMLALWYPSCASL